MLSHHTFPISKNIAELHFSFFHSFISDTKVYKQTNRQTDYSGNGNHRAMNSQINLAINSTQITTHITLYYSQKNCKTEYTI